jgi:Putative adhesin
MSWLYSIVFAGLMFSSNNDTPVQSCDIPQSDVLITESAPGDETEKFEQSYPISPNGRVSVSNVNGSIVVEAWDKNEVRLEATKIADSKEALADVEIKVESRADSFSVEADYGSWKRGEKNWKNRGKLEVQFRLSVPRTAVLDEVETVNGSVTVSNFTNMTKISAVNGNVTASNLRGTANLSTVNGEVAADFDRLESGSRISLETVNGRVNLVIPSDANATLKAESLNGNITNDFGLPVRKGKYVGRDLYGRVGTGEVQIKLESVNGPLSVTRKNDGKSTNPATNLLPQKSKDDDDDWDDDDEASSIKSAKINKDIAKAMKDAGKASAEGMKAAQAELARIAPELDRIKVEAVANINTKEIQERIKEGLALQNEALARMRTANWSAGAPYLEKKSNTFAVRGMPKVSIEAKDCGVKVRGWDKPEVKYVLTELAGRRSRTPVSITEDVTDSNVSLKVVNNTRASGRDNFNSDADRVRLEIFVPKKSNLKITTNGEIRLEGVSGDIELNGVDEAINVRDVDGKLYLSSVDGEVRVIGFKGDIESKTVDGDVYLEGDFSSITGTAVDGRYILTVPENQNADISANVETLSVENMRVPKVVKEGQWRFGSGGPKYTFRVTDGEILVRNANTLTN